MKFTKLLYGMLIAAAILATSACSSDDDGGSIADGVTGKYTINYHDYSGAITNNVNIEKAGDAALRLSIENLKYNDCTLGDINAICPMEVEDGNIYFEGECNTTITRATCDAECYISGYISEGNLVMEVEVSSDDFGEINIYANGTLQEEDNDDNNQSADLSTLILGVWRMTHYDGYPVPDNYIIKMNILASGNYEEYRYIPHEEGEDAYEPEETSASGTWELKGNEFWVTYNYGGGDFIRVGYFNIVEIKNDIMTTYVPGDEYEPGSYVKFKKVNLFN